MIQLATPETAHFVANNLRDVDKAMFRHPGVARLAAYKAAKDSLLSWTLSLPDGTPACLFGADGEIGDEWASAWMFSTPWVSKGKWELARNARTAIEHSRKFWPELRVKFERRNEDQDRFLRFAGFKTRRAFRLGEDLFQEMTV